jgi:hypothetical protein
MPHASPQAVCLDATSKANFSPKKLFPKLVSPAKITSPPAGMTPSIQPRLLAIALLNQLCHDRVVIKHA